MSVDILVVTMEMVLASSGQRPGMLAEQPAVPRPGCSYPALNDSSAGVRNPAPAVPEGDVLTRNQSKKSTEILLHEDLLECLCPRALLP